MPLCSSSRVLTLGPSPLAVIAWTLSIFANFQCNLVKPSNNNNNNNNKKAAFELFPDAPSSVGLWCYESSSAISTGSFMDDFGGYVDDSQFKAARVLGTTALCVGWLIVMFTIAAVNSNILHVPPVACSLCVAGGALCTGILQSLVFLIYRSSICANDGGGGGCELDTGGKCAIAAVVFWCVTGATSFGEAKDLMAAAAAEEEDSNSSANTIIGNVENNES